MASTSLVTAICERIIEKLKQENPEIEYKKKVKKEKSCKPKRTRKPKKIAKALKDLKKPKLLN